MRMITSLIIGLSVAMAQVQAQTQVNIQGTQNIVTQVHVTAMIKPISLKNSNTIFGKGMDIGLWSVGVCSEDPVHVNVPRTRLMMGFPGVRDIPNKEAIDLLTRKAAKDPKSIIGSNGDTILSFVSSGTAVGGLVTKSSVVAGVGVGMSLLQFIFRLVKADAPNPAPYMADLLPDSLPLPPLGCDDSHIIVASLSHGVTPEKVTVLVPVIGGLGK